MLPSKIPSAVGNAGGSLSSEFGSSLIQQRKMQWRTVNEEPPLCSFINGCMYIRFIDRRYNFYLFLEVFMYFYVNAPISLESFSSPDC